MAKAKKLPSGSWRVQIFVGKGEDGKRKYKSFTAPTKKEAEFLASEYAISKKESASPSKMTLGEAMDNYLNLRSNVLSPSTMRGYGIIRRNRFKAIINTPVMKLTSADIQAAINEEASTCSPKTVKNAHGFLCAVLADVRPDFNTHVRLPQPKKKAATVLTDEQITELIFALQGDSMEIPILLALWLGLRRSEILGLKWGAVTDTTITISSALIPDANHKFVIRDQTKTTSSARTLPLPSYISEKIKQMPRGKDSDPVFACSADQPLKHLKRICKAHGLPENLRIHDLRHTMASIGLKLNIADKYMMERGGWSSNQTMKNIYQHTISDAAQAANTMIDNHFESLFQEKMQHKKQHEN